MLAGRGPVGMTEERRTTGPDRRGAVLTGTFLIIGTVLGWQARA
jgi:hypothetical protein